MPKEFGLDFLKGIDKRSSFSKVHVLRVLLILDKGPRGRTKLGRELGLGEASVKTLLKYLAQEKIVEPTTKGHSLTDKGREIVDKLRKKISGPLRLDSSELTVRGKNVAFLIKDSASGVNNGMEQRDAAIKIGASGATTVTYTEEGFEVGDEKVDIPEEISREFNIEVGDVVVIGSNSGYRKAEEGAIATVLTLI